MKNNGGGELIDIEDKECPSDNGPQPHQLKYYEGEAKDLIDLVLYFFRLYLMNVNGFPGARDLATLGSNAFEAACRNLYGLKWEGSSVTVCLSVFLIVCNRAHGGRVHTRCPKLSEKSQLLSFDVTYS